MRGVDMRNRKPACPEYTCGYCCYECPNSRIDEFEDYYDLPASEIGAERISCKECYLNDGQCDSCYFQNTEDCPNFKHDSGC